MNTQELNRNIALGRLNQRVDLSNALDYRLECGHSDTQHKIAQQILDEGHVHACSACQLLKGEMI